MFYEHNVSESETSESETNDCDSELPVSDGYAYWLPVRGMAKDGCDSGLVDDHDASHFMPEFARTENKHVNDFVCGQCVLEHNNAAVDVFIIDDIENAPVEASSCTCAPTSFSPLPSGHGNVHIGCGLGDQLSTVGQPCSVSGPSDQDRHAFGSSFREATSVSPLQRVGVPATSFPEEAGGSAGTRTGTVDTPAEPPPREVGRAYVRADRRPEVVAAEDAVRVQPRLRQECG